MHYRQGDILIEQIAGLPDDAVEVKERDGRGRIILAYGEATGHAHAGDGRDAHYYHSKKTGLFYLVVVNPTPLEHEEHEAIPMKEDIYEVRRHREYTPQEIRQVVD
jgi:hypothetical protein